MHAKAHETVAGVFTIFLLILTLVATVPGCSKDESTSMEPPDVSDNRPATPLEVLQRFETTLELKNFEEYIALFAPGFFAILDTTVSDSLDIPPWWDWWGLEEMRESIRMLFDAPGVLGLELEWIVGEREPPTWPRTDARIRASKVSFTISLSDSDRVAMTKEWIFHLRAEAATEGDSLWEIAAWEDNGLWLQILDRRTRPAP
jgi:hypothetical protein